MIKNSKINSGKGALNQKSYSNNSNNQNLSHNNVTYKGNNDNRSNQFNPNNSSYLEKMFYYILEVYLSIKNKVLEKKKI